MRKISFLIVICLLIFGDYAHAQSPAGTLLIRGLPYVSIQSASQARGLVYAWDPLLKNATVSGGSGVIKFHVGSEFILDRGQMVKLDSEVRYVGGSVVAPLSAKEHLDRLMAVPAPRPEPVAPPTLESTLPAAATPVVSQALYGTQAAAFIPTHRIRKITIDAGHGGKDHGATSRTGLKEKDVVLEVSRMVRDELLGLNIEATMTRDADVFIPLAERANISNKKGADLFVSIHANASTSRNLSGFEVYYLSEAADDASLALQRAENSSIRFESGKFNSPGMGVKAIYWDLKESENRKSSIRMAEYVGTSVERSVPIAARRVKPAQFYVLKWSESPAILVELAYLSNDADEPKLR
ncbi:MAG TPA: N-acetylmuramoyl-L-alanine amidase, partial [Candidatus Omnitrophota bacterium]|nr:N-acetylmuramoyl-L-alanine amidase [Candidatus Omnitrophota bacterium]